MTIKDDLDAFVQNQLDFRDSGQAPHAGGPWTALNGLSWSSPSLLCSPSHSCGRGAAVYHAARSVFRCLAKVNSDNGVERVWSQSSLVTLWWHLCRQMMLSVWHHRTLVSDEHWHSLQLTGVRGHLHMPDSFCPQQADKKLPENDDSLISYHNRGRSSRSKGRAEINCVSSCCIYQTSFQTSAIFI